EASQGILRPGTLAKPVFTPADIMENFDRKGKTQTYIGCVKTVTEAFASGVRVWQKAYHNESIPFPQGASCTFTLTPCDNVPVALSSGGSFGDDVMTEEALYSYMIYRMPAEDKNVLEVFKATAKALSVCFREWKDSCSIVGITASGGIAPQPTPMGPGPVRGAKGENGRLLGGYFDGDKMCREMIAHFEKNSEK
ncbi:MAG: hypothetical protein PHW46_01220, partial [Candidatus Omnitrophica bacterium]|nr:hypothetical protein [Candidatus Omnitrophota bacterium]